MSPNCTICTDPLMIRGHIYSTSCGHVFHYNCLCDWLGRSETCPQCRKYCTVRLISRIHLTDCDDNGDNSLVENLAFDRMKREYCELKAIASNYELELASMKEEQKKYSFLQTALNDSKESAEFLLSSDQNPESLAMLAAMLKSKLNQTLKRLDDNKSDSI